MYLFDFPQVGVELRLSGEDPEAQRAVASYERQYRVEAKRVGRDVFVSLFGGTGPGRKYFSVPDQLRSVKFEWLVVVREERTGYLTSSQRDAMPGMVVLIPHSSGECLRPFGRDRGTARFSGRALSVERLNWVQPNQGTVPGRCQVSLQSLSVGLRPKFAHSREEREECGLPSESPLGFEPKVDVLGEGITVQLDLTREGGVEQMVVPTSQGGFKPTIGWAELSPARRAVVTKLVCGEYAEDYRLDVRERWNRYKRDFGDPRWEIPFNWEAHRASQSWQRRRDPKPDQFPAHIGLDGFPVRRGRSCDHLHFAQGVDSTHEEPVEDDEGGYGDPDDRW